MRGLCVLVRDVVCAVVRCTVSGVQCAVCGVWCVYVMLCVECALVYTSACMVDNVSLYLALPISETHQSSCIHLRLASVDTNGRVCLFDDPRTTHSLHLSIHPSIQGR